MNQTKQTLTLQVDHDRQGTYFTLPFEMPPGTESMTLTYRYDRHIFSSGQQDGGTFRSRQEANIIDLGLIAPDGSQVGASGSDKTTFTISETAATPGYRPRPLIPGAWQILVGAYKVAPGGVTVVYDLTFTSKATRLLKGDLHTHTIASDGVLTADELAARALRHGLDFLAITDHNQPVSTDSLPRIPGLTLIPGLEWTHYQGHANFLGVDQPYDAPFAANSFEEARELFLLARDRGALITINHPFDEGSGFKFPMDALPFDCLEIWNGPMRESNLRAVGYWQSLLASGKKVPVCGGSDYHRDTPFLFLGGPTTCVYSESAGKSDILNALRRGRAFITFAPNGPTLEMTCGDAIMGDSVSWQGQSTLEISAQRLLAGDVLRVVTAQTSDTILQAPAGGEFTAEYAVKQPGFARIEIMRSFLPGIPMLPALISNPIYFDDPKTE